MPCKQTMDWFRPAEKVSSTNMPRFLEAQFSRRARSSQNPSTTSTEVQVLFDDYVMFNES
ncbi:uncharacterized protein RSE6_12056 [Rhynchosporium secalis]|uniref:Uncharacterized protein n=1 Tax=Rhynchosporium secalis TaxID=38038 RepID=A0A1E1MPG1_RHYSE|nr:uncharacterized protein RSE6_12056 [Rhynchosporium secalis]